MNFNGFGFDDIFSNIFGGFGGSRRQEESKVGEDITLRINLTFLEACLGCKKTISYSRVEQCPTCKGTGAKNGTEYTTCPVCNGSGQERVTKQVFGLGNVVTVRPCHNCNGTGKYIKEKCASCGGTGTIRKTRNLDIPIPAGIDNGQVMTINGGGHANAKTGLCGNLYIEVTVQNHTMLKRDGFDVFITVPIPLSVAMLGGKIEVPGINETLSLDIPELTQTGTVFTIKGKGIKYLKKEARGNVYVTVVIELPKSLDKKSKQDLENISKLVDNSNYSKFKDYTKKVDSLKK